jgi:putative hydrolase of the HAD superfamily
VHVTVETLFLDAGGVLVFPNWNRISEALASHAVYVEPAALAAAEPRAKWILDTGKASGVLNDHERGWKYFNLILEGAGVPLSDATDAALAELHEYHAVHNLWEFLPPDVVPALERLRAIVPRMVVISNANGTLHAVFDRLGLTRHFDLAFDSYREGVEKPDPRLFRIALERVGARPETTTHVGDLYHVDVVGARNAKLGAVLLDPTGIYEDFDCVRVKSLDALADLLSTSAAFIRPDP